MQQLSQMEWRKGIDVSLLLLSTLISVWQQLSQMEWQKGIDVSLLLLSTLICVWQQLSRKGIDVSLRHSRLRG